MNTASFSHSIAAAVPAAAFLLFSQGAVAQTYVEVTPAAGGVTASSHDGNVPANTSSVDKAEAAFGQGRTEVSPLSLAVAAGSVARGSYLSPSLVVKGDESKASGQSLDSGSISTLHSLMRDVVTSGTGTALKSVPGGAVYAKTGTAEFGGGDEPKTRAWITGWQGTVAFAVLVEEGKSGGTVAGPVAARFLTNLANS